MPGGAVTACPTATSGCPGSWRWGSWRSPRASSRTWSRRLYQDALRSDLPEFIGWALVYQAEAGDLASVPLARAVTGQVTNPALQARAAALDGLPG